MKANKDQMLLQKNKVKWWLLHGGSQGGDRGEWESSAGQMQSSKLMFEPFMLTEANRVLTLDRKRRLAKKDMVRKQTC